MSVIGSISIKDSASAVLRSFRSEQTAFRKDVEKTKKELKATWDKNYTAKLDTSSSMKKADGLIGKVKQLGKAVASPVIRAKDEASAKISKIGNAVKSVGNKVASPVIKAKDTASKALGVVGSKMKTVGGMVARPVVALKDGATAGLSSIKSLLGTLAKGVTIAAGVAGVGLTAVVGGALSSGASLQQSIGGVETLFKGDAGVVTANADKAFKTAGLSANEYMETVTGFSASLLQSLGGDTAKAAEMADMAIIDMADNANKMGTSMESIQNAYSGFAKQNYTMLDNLKLGYGGTQEEMKRLLSDAGKISGVKYDIGNLADVYNAIHVIQGSLDITGTTAKEASETFSGSFAAMKASVTNLLGNLAVGGDVKASMGQLVESASTFLIGNAVPMIGNVITALPGAIKTGLQSAAPKIKELGQSIVGSLKDGLTALFPSLGPAIEKGMDTAVSAMPVFISGVKSVISTVASMAGGFAPVLPLLASFGGSMITTIQTVAGACIPVLSSIISTVQTMLPVILPVIQTVVTTIGNIIAQAAPVISGLVQGIGTVISTLAPIFSTIFSEIGEKVGTVISFVGERMGFIQEIIGFVAPLIGDILSTAWGVISPVIDIVISVFKILFSVVQKVFPGIQKVIETVWNVVKPLVEGIGNVIGKIADWFGNVADAISGEDVPAADIGTNAEGDNNWKGGLTWVGEKGAELVNLPRGSRILPHKESVAAASGMSSAVSAAKGAVTNVVQNIMSGSGSSNTLDSILELVREIAKRILTDRDTGNRAGADGTVTLQGKGKSIAITIAKLADKIVVRDEDDIDEIADRVAKKVLEVVVNMG